MSTTLTIILLGFLAAYVATVALLGRRPGPAAKTAYETGAICIVLAGIFGLSSLVDGIGRIAEPFVCDPGQRFETVWTESLHNGRRRQTSERWCVGAAGRRPSSYFGPYALFATTGLVVFTAIGTAGVLIARSRARR